MTIRLSVAKLLLAALLTTAWSLTQALELIDDLELEFGDGLSRTIAMDPAGEFAYLTSDHEATPRGSSKVVKFNLETLEVEDSLTLAPEKGRVLTAALAPSGEYLVLGMRHTTGDWERTPFLIKVDLESFESVAIIEFDDQDKESIRASVIDSASEFAYFAVHMESGPDRLIKVDLASFEWVETIEMESGDRTLRAGLIDPLDEYAYFGSDTDPGRIVKVDLAAFERVDMIELPGSGGVRPRLSVMDSNGEFAYFATRPGSGERIWVAKIDLQNFEYVESIELASGEVDAGSIMIDPADNFVFVVSPGLSPNPGKLVRIDLDSFSRLDALDIGDGSTQMFSDLPRIGAMGVDGSNAFVVTRSDIANWGEPDMIKKVDLSAFEVVDAKRLDAEELAPQAPVMDPAGQYGYFVTNSQPVRVVRIDLDTFERVDGVQFSMDERPIRAAAIDPTGEYAYFGTDTSPGRIVKVSLETMEWVDTIVLEEGENSLQSAVIDPTGDFAYFGIGTDPGQVIKIDLKNFTRAGGITLASNERNLGSAVIDPAGSYAYFSTNQARVVKIDLSDFSRVGAINLGSDFSNLGSAAIDSAGESAYFRFSAGGGKGLVRIDLESFQHVDSVFIEEGERMRSMVVDPLGHFAYVGLEDHPERYVAKIDLQSFELVKSVLTSIAEGFDFGAGPPISAMTDPAGNFAYFGTDAGQRPGWIHRLAINREMTFSPATLSFDRVAVGTTSPIQTATLHNTGTLPLTDLNFSVSGSGFAVNFSDCSDLELGESCEVEVSYTAFSHSPSIGTLTVEDDDRTTGHLELLGNYDGLFYDRFEQAEQ
jgi:DNA-binding beta-propeller fold protein YncE